MGNTFNYITYQRTKFLAQPTITMGSCPSTTKSGSRPETMRTRPHPDSVTDDRLRDLFSDTINGCPGDSPSPSHSDIERTLFATRWRQLNPKAQTLLNTWLKAARDSESSAKRSATLVRLLTSPRASEWLQQRLLSLYSTFIEGEPPAQTAGESTAQTWDESTAAQQYV